jgi:hypothetical protein
VTVTVGVHRTVGASASASGPRSPGRYAGCPAVGDRWADLVPARVLAGGQRLADAGRAVVDADVALAAAGVCELGESPVLLGDEEVAGGSPVGLGFDEVIGRPWHGS